MRETSKSTAGKIVPGIILIMISVLFSFFFAEVMCRYYYFGNLSNLTKTPESKFVHYDEQLGWSNIPNAEGYFSSPKEGFLGYVKFDENGIRVNDNNFIHEGEAILIVGDSVTAGLEVDNNETYAAILERLFFENGCNYRVYNAGVRGYGTDQSFWNMERLLDIIKPKYVIYMFNSNDFLDNKTIKQSNREYGKPVFISIDNKLSTINRPSKKFKKNYYAFIRYGNKGYEISEGKIDEKLRSIMESIKNNFALYYPLNVVYEQLQVSPTVAIAKKSKYTDLEILKLILTAMKRDDTELFLTSFPSESEEGYIDNLARISDKLEIKYLNITPYFTEEPESYHWKKDGHWNEKGHSQGAAAIYELLEPHLCVQ